jgi:hypothetical protein
LAQAAQVTYFMSILTTNANGVSNLTHDGSLGIVNV